MVTTWRIDLMPRRIAKNLTAAWRNFFMRLAPNCICRDQDARPAHALVAAPAKTDCTVTVCTDLYTRPPGIERNVRDRHQLPGTQARQPPRPGSMPETKRDIGDLRRAAHDPATARVQLPAGLASGARTGPCPSHARSGRGMRGRAVTHGHSHWPPDQDYRGHGCS